MGNKIRLNAPAGNLPALIAGVEAGADSVYIGFRSPTNLRNLPGLNFSLEEADEGVRYAHRRDVEVYVTVNTLPLDHQLEECFRAVDHADEVGADAVIAADWAVLEYARTNHPRLEIHLSCMAGVADAAAVRFYRERFGVKIVILPRVLTVRQIAALRRQTDALLEVMVFGTLCANYEARCHLSSFITGRSANSFGACAPAEMVVFEKDGTGRTVIRLNNVTINDVACDEPMTYPTPCKGKYHNLSTGRTLHAFQESSSLNALILLPKLAAAGVNMLKVEGRQRSAAYVQQVTLAWRAAIDRFNQTPLARWQPWESSELELVVEGQKTTTGALGGDVL